MARLCKTLLILLIALLAACQEGGEAGRLLGQWRLEGSDDRYIAFSGSVAVFRNTRGDQVFANFQHRGDSLFLQCVSIEARRSDTLLVEHHWDMRPFADIRLRVESLGGSHMVLSDGPKVWRLSLY